MEKKKSIKTRFMAGALALMLSGAPMTVVKGEEQLVQEETQVELIDMFKTDYEITDPKYDTLYENKYVSEDGTIEKWYCSYMPTIDGLKRTNESRPLQYFDYPDGESCDIKEKHAHLYFCSPTGFFKPFYSEETVIYENDDSRIKTRAIVKINEKALYLLNDFGLYRLCDNLPYMQMELENSQLHGRLGVIYLIPTKLEDDSLELNVIVNSNVEAQYTNEMNGYLISYENSYLTKDSQSKKKLVLKNNYK